jgi:hypothetical protein
MRLGSQKVLLQREWSGEEINENTSFSSAVIRDNGVGGVGTVEM